MPKDTARHRAATKRQKDSGDTFAHLQGDGKPAELDALVGSAARALAKVGSPAALAVLLQALDGAGGLTGDPLFADRAGTLLKTSLRSALEACPRAALLEAARQHPSAFVRGFVENLPDDKLPGKEESGN